MMKLLKILAFLIFSTLSASAQTLLQVAPIGNNGIAKFAKTLSTDPSQTCVGFAHYFGGSGQLGIADSANDIWHLGSISADGSQAIWYAQPCTSQTINFSRATTAPYTLGWIAEYTGIGQFDTGSPAQGASTTPSAVLNPATAGEFLIVGIGETGPTIPSMTASIPLTLEWAGYNGVQISLMDGAIPAGLYTGGAQYNNASYTPHWWETMLAFRPYNAPPPPPPINLTVGGSLLFDDSTPMAFGVTINIQQGDNNGNWVNAGTVTSDASGNITGNLSVNPNLVNGSGFVNFQFSVAGIPSSIAQTLPLQMFQHGSTGVNFNLVLFKSNMIPKSFVAGLIP